MPKWLSSFFGAGPKAEPQSSAGPGKPRQAVRPERSFNDAKDLRARPSSAATGEESRRASDSGTTTRRHKSSTAEAERTPRKAKRSETQETGTTSTGVQPKRDRVRARSDASLVNKVEVAVPKLAIPKPTVEGRSQQAGVQFEASAPKEVASSQRRKVRDLTPPPSRNRLGEDSKDATTKRRPREKEPSVKATSVSTLRAGLISPRKARALSRPTDSVDAPISFTPSMHATMGPFEDSEDASSARGSLDKGELFRNGSSGGQSRKASLGNLLDGLDSQLSELEEMDMEQEMDRQQEISVHPGFVTPNTMRSKFPRASSRAATYVPVKFCVRSIGGMRDNKEKVNQDNFASMPEVLKEFGLTCGLFGMFDGHGPYGHHVSKFIRERICRNLGASRLARANTLKKGCQLVEKAIAKTAKQLEEQPEIDSMYSGSTLVLALVWHSHVISCNVGDSRLCMVRTCGPNRFMPVPLSWDHKPTRRDEAERIVEEGGRVKQQVIRGRPVGPLRVFLEFTDSPGLAMTRSMGDQMAASIGVHCKPETKTVRLVPGDRFLVLASDGVWDVVSNEEVANMIGPCLSAKDAATRLKDEVLSRWADRRDIPKGYRDDISMLVTSLMDVAPRAEEPLSETPPEEVKVALDATNRPGPKSSILSTALDQLVDRTRSLHGQSGGSNQAGEHMNGAPNGVLTPENTI